jgi:hypothetical protein
MLLLRVLARRQVGISEFGLQLHAEHADKAGIGLPQSARCSPAMIPRPFEPMDIGDVRFRPGSANTLAIDPVKKPASPPNTVEAMTLLLPLLTPQHDAGSVTAPLGD